MRIHGPFVRRTLIIIFIVGCLLFNRPFDSHAQSSADQIVYSVQTTSGGSDLYLMNADGSGTRQLTHNGASSSPTWSPRHRQIAYTSRQNDVTNIYVMNADGSGTQQITRDAGTNNDSPSWSPDSQQIAFVSNGSGKSDVWAVSANGGKAHQLTRDATAESVTPAWSPNGQHIAYATSRDGHFEIYLMTNDGSTPNRLTTSDGDSDSPAWSPDGQHIAYVLTQNGGSSILTIGVTGGQPSQVYEVLDGFIGTLSWSPDGQSIAFMVTDNKKAHSVRTVTISGAKTTQLTEASVQAGWPSWGALKPITTIAEVSSVTDSGNPDVAIGATDSPVESTLSLIATRPKSGAEAARYGSVWTNAGFRLVTSPGTQQYEVSIAPGKTLRFAFNWCADSATKLKDIVDPLVVTLYVTGTKLDDSQILVYDEGLCRKWATLVSGWKTGGQAILVIDYTLNREIAFRSGTVDAGEYIHHLVIHVQ